MQLSSPYKIQDEKYLQNLQSILKAVETTTETSFDAFSNFISSTVWKSSKGVAETWIEKVAQDDWNALQETSKDSIEDKRLKHYRRTQVIKACSQLVYFLARNPNVLQKMTTRLMVREILANQLEINDQDRLIATELGLPYKKWKQLIGAVSHIEFPESTCNLSALPIVTLDEHGDFSCDIIFDGHIIDSSEKQLPGVKINYGIGEGIFGMGPIIALIHKPISIITISNDVMSRFDNLLGHTPQESKIRNMVIGELSGLLAWKRRSFGGNKPEQKKETSLSPAWKPII